MVLAVLSTSDKIQLAIAIITGVAVMIAAASAWIGIVNERKRTQPLVIAHEAQGRHLGSGHALRGVWVVDGYITSEGSGSAFNVRFGVEFHGIRYPYRASPHDPGFGNLQRVLRPTNRHPTKGHSSVIIDSLDLVGVAAEGGDPDPGRVYWARYENAQGKTWETRNPGDRAARLDIRRVRLVRLHEGFEERRRNKAREHGVEWERNALAELRSGMTPIDCDRDEPNAPQR